MLDLSNVVNMFCRVLLYFFSKKKTFWVFLVWTKEQIEWNICIQIINKIIVTNRFNMIYLNVDMTTPKIEWELEIVSTIVYSVKNS